MSALLVADAVERISPELYLEGEESALQRHEYIDGQIRAMAGASTVHEKVAGYLFYLIYGRTMGGKCQTFKGDMKLRIEGDPLEVFYYPDLMVTCQPSDDHAFYKRFPKLLIEVVSNDRSRDFLEKQAAYTAIASLEEYVIVDPHPDHAKVHVYRRRLGWRPPEVYAAGSFRLESIDLELTVEDIMARAV
jgi:Uma2 family endonuclease